MKHLLFLGTARADLKAFPDRAMTLLIERFENVWDPIEDSPEVAAEMERRSVLMIPLIEYLRRQGWTKQEAAQRLDASEDRIAMLLAGDIDSFTEASLASMCRAAGLPMQPCGGLDMMANPAAAPRTSLENA